VRTSTETARHWWAFLFLGLACVKAWSQALLDPDAAFRREREREALRRELLEPDPSVRLAPASAAQHRLPEGESPCSTVKSVRVEGLAAIDRDEDWARAHLGGADGTDSPVGRCLGTMGISVLLGRLQNALVAEGFATTRVVVPEQDLRTGELGLTVIPGRVRSVRTDAPTAGVQPPLRAGDVLNLRAIEQALEALQRVPTAQASIRIEPAEPVVPGAGWSDVVIASAELLAGRRLTGLALGLRGAVAGLRYEVFVGTPVSKPDALHVPHTTGGFSLVWSY
jgi:hemolysin activation/secretion protein